MSVLPGAESRVLGAILACVLAVGCAAPGPRPGPYPDGCAGYGFTLDRCAAVVARGLEQAGVDRAEIASIDLLAIPSQSPHFGPGIVAVLGFHLADGSTVRQQILCVGISAGFDPACGDDARVHVGVGVDRDRPCTDGDPPVCATPPPAPPPNLIALASPLTIAARDIPVDHAGRYEVRLGAATLPNGYLSERTLTLVDDHPTAFWIEGARLEVRPDIAGRPPVGSLYREPFDGLEPVSAWFVFEVTRYVEPGAVRIRGISVR